MVILGALKCHLLINFFKTKVLIAKNESFQRKKILDEEGSPGKLFSSHLPLKNSACLSLKAVKSDVLLLPFVRSTRSTQLFHYFVSIFPIFFLVPFAQLLEKSNWKPQNKRVFLHTLCILLKRNTYRHLQANQLCRLSSHLWPRALDVVKLTAAR